MEVRELSIGDYVLNGGEVAALAIIEAVVRLLPGFMGNAESLAEESHADGLLEYPVYTKPADLARPRGARGAALRRPRADRAPGATTSPYDGPRSADPTSPTPPARSTRRLRRADRAGRLRRRRRAVHPAARVLGPGAAGQPGGAHPAAARETSPTCRRGCGTWTTLVLRSGGRLVGAVRGRLEGDAWDIGRLMVAPDLQGAGIGRLLLDAIELAAPEDATGSCCSPAPCSERNIRIYKKAGYRLLGPDPDAAGRRTPAQAASLAVDEAVEAHSAELGQPLGLLGQVGQRRPRVDRDPQLLARGARAPGAEDLVADQNSTGAAEGAPEVLAVGLLGYDELPVARLEEQVERSEQVDEARDDRAARRVLRGRPRGSSAPRRRPSPRPTSCGPVRLDVLDGRVDVAGDLLWRRRAQQPQHATHEVERRTRAPGRTTPAGYPLQDGGDVPGWSSSPPWSAASRNGCS